jgi:hypothetical protein
MAIPGEVARDFKTADSGGSITDDVPVLRTDYAASETSLFGVREVAQRVFP